MRYFLLLVLTIAVVAGCNDCDTCEHQKESGGVLYLNDSSKVKPPKLPDSVTVKNGDVVTGLDFVRPKDPVTGVRAPYPGALDRPRYRTYAIDTSSLPTRTMPDFTDASVGIMISNMGSQAPTQITLCIVTPLQNMIMDVKGGNMTAPLLWPDPNIPGQACSESSPEKWYLSESQYCWVGRTDPMYLMAFTNAIKAYEAELGRRGYLFPCRVVGLDYGNSLCLPVTGVQIQRIERDGQITEFRIILRH